MAHHKVSRTQSANLWNLGDNQNWSWKSGKDSWSSWCWFSQWFTWLLGFLVFCCFLTFWWTIFWADKSCLNFALITSFLFRVPNITLFIWTKKSIPTCRSAIWRSSWTDEPKIDFSFCTSIIRNFIFIITNFFWTNNSIPNHRCTDRLFSNTFEASFNFARWATAVII